jgi:Co/Zn/Cd efflux system component
MNFWQSMLQDGHDKSWSSKRIITFLAFILVSVAFIADQFTIYKANETLFDSVIYLVIAGLGFTASEKFARKDKPNE